LNGYFADGAWTFPVGKIHPQTQRLLRVAEEALYLGISYAKVGNWTGDIGHAIEKFVRKNGFSVVKEMVGHGIGTSLHEEPQIPNFGRSGQGVQLQEGMTFCVEPMVNAGRREIRALSDEWTIVTNDRSLSAHFEHTIAITKNGARILTQ